MGTDTMSDRFTVITCEGYLTERSGGHGRAHGLSATVVDEITGRAMATFQSEHVGYSYFSGAGRRDAALRLANERAAELNAWHEREAAS